MTPERYRRVRELFEEALDAAPADVIKWLDEHAPGERDVGAEVVSLLKHHSGAGSFLVEPVAGRVPKLLADDDVLPAGTALGPYVIERELGRGGMGRVYLARDARLNRTVALKALPPEMTRDQAQRERLRREARAAAALSHPGICTVFALEELNGDLFIVSEYIAGHMLREEIGEARSRPSPEEVQRTAREIAEALGAAHAKGITHRDLKPENIMRAADGQLKILDFGLARFDEPREETGQPMTQPGTLIGTPAYMAPEQLQGQTADARADVFALGVVLYEYACGVHPFADSSPLGVAGRVLHGQATPLAERRPDLPADLVAIVERCLEKSPGARFASAGEVVHALASSNLTGRGRVVTVWWRRHQAAVVALYLVGSVVGWLVKEWQHGLADTIFLVIGLSATAAATFRGHLMFTQRMNPAGFPAERERARPFTLGLDLVISLALVVDGVLMSGASPLASLLASALGIILALVSLVVEPTTTEAAFRFGTADSVSEKARASQEKASR